MTDEVEIQALKDELRTTKLSLRLVLLVGDDDLTIETRQQLAEVDEMLQNI